MAARNVLLPKLDSARRLPAVRRTALLEAVQLLVHLAISKQGVISGTLKNTLSATVKSLEGMGDQKSQRVAWGVVGQQRPIMETGVSNLTQDASPALIHFADGQTQQWLMVRIPEPQ